MLFTKALRLIVFVCFIASATGSGALAAEKDQLNLNREYFRSYAADAGYVLRAPTRWNAADWRQALLLSGAALTLYHNDEKIEHWAQRQRNSTSNQVSGWVRHCGDVRCIAPALGLTYAAGKHNDNDRLTRTALLGMESLVIADGITGSLKLLTHRHRPSTGDPYNTWDGPGFHNPNDSFASGHATSAFAVATVIATEYQGKRGVPQMAYGLAALTSLSRVNDNQHWASDVFAGSVIGYYTAKLVTKRHAESSPSGQNSQTPSGVQPLAAYQLHFK
ncbi:MAG: phosphatase PAP2 family protein [Anaerohalosphaeraceae bacterium]